MTARLLLSERFYPLVMRGCCFPTTALSAYLCRRLESSWSSGVRRRQWDDRAVPQPSSGSGWDRISWQSSLGWPRPRYILCKKQTVSNSQPGEMPGLKPEIIFSIFCKSEAAAWVCRHLDASGLELAPGILKSNGCVVKNRKNLTDWAGVPITTQPVASLPETKDWRDTSKPMLAQTSVPLKKGGSAGGCRYGLSYYASD